MELFFATPRARRLLSLSHIHKFDKLVLFTLGCCYCYSYQNHSLSSHILFLYISTLSSSLYPCPTSILTSLSLTISSFHFFLSFSLTLFLSLSLTHTLPHTFFSLFSLHLTLSSSFLNFSLYTHYLTRSLTHTLFLLHA